MKNFIKILVVSLLFTGCKIVDDNLPGYTEEGKSTLGCLINGEKFNPRLHQSGQGLIYNERAFKISVKQNKESYASDVFLRIVVNEYPIEEGRVYALATFSEEEGAAYGEFSYSVNTDKPGMRQRRTYNTSIEHSGELLITKHDLDNRFISGRFWFDVKTKESGVTEIRQGRFDLKYGGY